MTDDAFIPASERSPYPIGELTVLITQYRGLARSHAVVDSVAAELAEALREANAYMAAHAKADDPRMLQGHDALARFDNLTKGATE